MKWDVPSGGNGHHYELVPTSVTWFVANAAANSSSFYGVQGHLVTVTSQAEMDFIVNTFPTPSFFGPWMGLHDPQGDNTFEWVTGEPLVYTNWEPITGEPSTLTEQCGHWFLPTIFGPDTWNDSNCTISLAYIIEYDTIPPVLIPTLGEWGLISLGLLFLCRAAIVLKRKEKIFIAS